MENPITNLTSKEVSIIILETGIFEDYSIDYIKEIDGKFKCRLKQPWLRAASGYTFYPMNSQIPFDSKEEAIESCLIHIRSMGGLGSVKFDEYNDFCSKKKISKKKELVVIDSIIVEPISKIIEEPISETININQ